MMAHVRDHDGKDHGWDIDWIDHEQVQTASIMMIQIGLIMMVSFTDQDAADGIDHEVIIDHWFVMIGIHLQLAL